MKLKPLLSIITIILLFPIFFFLGCKNNAEIESLKIEVEELKEQLEKEEIVDETKEDMEEEATEGEAPTLPDIIFFNGTILTMDKAQPQAQAIAINDERIMTVGSNEEIMALQGVETLVIDLEQRTLMPGFVDAHTHMFRTNFGTSQARQSVSEPNILDTNIEYMEAIQAVAIQYGITTVGAMTPKESVAKEIIALDQKGKLLMRANMYLAYTDNCGEPMGDWYKAYLAGHEYSDKLKVGGIKIFSDGGSCNKPAVSFERIDGTGYGDLYFTHEELSQIVSDLHSQGYQVAIHAIGDRALEQVQDVYEEVLGGGPNIYHHRIEHNLLIRPDLMARYTEIGIVPVILGLRPTCLLISDDLDSNIPAEYHTWLWPWRDLLDANPDLPVAWHSDWRLTTLDTMRQLHGFTTRKQIAEDGSLCEPTPEIAIGIINIQEALEIMTIGSAYALSRDDEVGSLEPGKYADLIILSDNPLTVLPDSLLDIKVQLTMIGGQVMYLAEGQEALFP